MRNSVAAVASLWGWVFIMIFQSIKRSSVASGLARAVVALLPLAVSAHAADGWPSTVNARYKLMFAGFEVGSYNFQSTTDGRSYATDGSAKVSALFGAFKWTGGISSTGKLAASAPKPDAYKLNYKAKKKRGAVELGFSNGTVVSISLVPNKPPKPDTVPVRKDQLAGVFDPMSSILALTHAGNSDPCHRTIPVFDGKARFDLVLSPKGDEPLREAKPSGQPARLKVCRVRYVPISGHKPKDFVKPWVDYDGIEIALRPVPAANVYVPYRVSIPTTLGAAVMLADSVNITGPNNARIALRQ